MTVRVLQGTPHDCATDGHMIALRAKRLFDGTEVEITAFCDLCRVIMLPSSSLDGPSADWLMRIVDRARFAPDAPPEAYEQLFV
jgi:hypothetical protein